MTKIVETRFAINTNNELGVVELEDGEITAGIMMGHATEETINRLIANLEEIRQALPNIFPVFH